MHVLQQLVDELLEVALRDHPRQKLERTRPDRDVVVRQALQDELLVLDDGARVRAHEVDKADEAEVLEVLVRVVDELAEVVRAQLDDCGHVATLRAVGALRVRQRERERVDALVLQRLGGRVLDDGRERLEQLARESRLLRDEASEQFDDLDEHPVVRRCRQQTKELRGARAAQRARRAPSRPGPREKPWRAHLRCHRQVVVRVLVRKLADDVHGARDDRCLAVREPLLEALEREAKPLRVAHEELEHGRDGLLAHVRLGV